MGVVLFDLEGTLVKTRGPITIKELKSQAKRKLSELGIPSKILCKTDKIPLMQNEAHQYVEKEFSYNRRILFNLEFDKFMKNYEIPAATNSSLYDDTPRTLQALRKISAIMGIVTNTSREALEVIFAAHQIEPFFEVTVTREDVKMLKPDPEGIQLALKRLRRQKGCFFFVGDSTFDVTAATKAKGISILIRRKYSNGLTKPGDYVVQSLLEVPDIVEKSIRPVK